VTAAAFASLLDGRPIGASRWMAKCPGHRDKNPSLSIAEGRQGRVLVTCFASCSVTSILRAMGLQLRDLFSAEPPSPAQRKAIEKQRERERMAGRRIGEAAEYARHAEDHVHHIGAELATLSNEDPRAPAMTRLFHEASTVAQMAEQNWQEMRTGRG
jgi:DNA primase